MFEVGTIACVVRTYRVLAIIGMLAIKYVQVCTLLVRRQPEAGTLFIQTLCKMIRDKHREKCLEGILKATINRMSKQAKVCKENGVRRLVTQVPVYESCLRKPYKFIKDEQAVPAYGRLLEE